MPLSMHVALNYAIRLLPYFGANFHTPFLKTSGMWCSGITSASHAEGPGFEPRRVHNFLVAWSILQGNYARFWKIQYAKNKNVCEKAFSVFFSQVQKSKETTARVVVYRELGISHSYTLEASFCGADGTCGDFSNMHFSPRHLE